MSRLVLAAWVVVGLCACSSSGPVNYVEPGVDAVDAVADIEDDAWPAEPDALEETLAGDLVEDLSGTDGALDDAAEPDVTADSAETDLVPSELVEDVLQVEEIVEEPPLDVSLVETSMDEPWAEVRLLSIDHPGLGADKYIERTRRSDPALSALFAGETEPGADRFLLHISALCLEAPEQAVLLVHGAGGDADSSFVAPGLMGGLATDLMDAGKCVFAVTFPHPFGDNYNQAIQLAGALQEVRLISGIASPDLVAHSKGGIAALTLLTGLAAAKVGLDAEQPLGELVLLGVPMGGQDFSFRHPAFNYPVDLYGLAMPSSWDKILEWGVWKDVYDESIYGGAFDGVLQMLTALDESYALSMMEQDWYTTYYGGDGFVSHSQGIAKAIEMGGGFMAELHKHKVPSDQSVHVVSGGTALMGGVLWETAGPSDGLVFVDSAQDESLFAGEVNGQHFGLLNHWDLVASSTAREWCLGIL